MAKIDFDMNDTPFGSKPDRNQDDEDYQNSTRIRRTEISKEKQDIEIERTKWKSRRIMAWLALLAEILVTIALFLLPIEEKRMSIITEAIIWFYFSMTSIIGFYMGATTWAYIGKGRGK